RRGGDGAASIGIVRVAWLHPRHVALGEVITRAGRSHRWQVPSMGCKREVRIARHDLRSRVSACRYTARSTVTTGKWSLKPAGSNSVGQLGWPCLRGWGYSPDLTMSAYTTTVVKSMTDSAPDPARNETDSFGPIEVPADALWVAQTERSRRFFAI